MKPRNIVVEAFKEIGRVVRIAHVGGRRVLRAQIEQRFKWVAVDDGPNRKQRRHYLSVLRRMG